MCEARAFSLEIRLESLLRAASQRDESMFVPFSFAAEDLPRVEQAVEAQVRNFRDARARRVKDFEYGGVSQAQGRIRVRGTEQEVDLLGVEQAW